MPQGNARPGQADQSASNGPSNAIDFAVQQALSKIATATLVKVEAVTNAGEASPVGRVDIRPLVAQLDGAGNAVPHDVVNDVPYFRVQGGTNAIIIDPVVGDIGIAVFMSRDISSVKANKKESNPGSRRRFDMADAIYIGGVLNGIPTQFIRFSGDGVEIKAKTTVTGDFIVTGKMNVGDTITAGGDVIGQGKSLHNHVHLGVTSGSGTSGPPA